MKLTEDKVAKILLALDITSQDLAARDFALSLAGRLQAELIGLLVEDEDLLASAQYPFASEINASSASERKLEYADMERSLRAWTTQTQQQLLKKAQEEKIKCSFRMLRGRKTQIFLEQSEAPSLLVFSGLRTSFYLTQRKPHTVYLLVDDNSNLEHSLLIIRQLIGEGINDVVIINNGSEKSRDKISTAIDQITKLHAHAQVKELKLDTDIPQQLSVVTRKQSAVVILVPASHQICQQLPVFKEMQNYVSCPVVVVN